MFAQLYWRSDRVDHIARHGVTPDDVEEAVFDDPERKLFRGPRSERDRTRFVYYVYGRTQDGRYLLVVLLDLGGRNALPLTARDMTQAERRRYGG
ncbi:MAG: BrnT family toxin [Chloroflexi bacterium]|nr:BrnT family toxin [Chloroflexota bacterium]